MAYATADEAPRVEELAAGVYAPGSAEQFERMRPGSPFGELELVFDSGPGPMSAIAAETEVMTYREAIRLALREELARDERVFVMGEEVGVFDGAYKVTAGLLDEFGPDRVRDTPISEEGFVGAGVGAAMLGERPVVEIMTLNFLLVAMDQVVNHAAKIGAMFGGEVRCPLVIRTPNGAGNQLTAQHSQSFEGWFAATPGLKVVAPANPADAKGLLKAAIRDDDPVLVVENLVIYKEKGAVPLDPDFVTPIGRAAVARAGSDVTLVAHGYSVVRALARRGSAGRISRRGCGGRRPAFAAPAGCRDRCRLGREDQSGRLRRRGMADLRRYGRARRAHPEGVLRRPRCAGRARRHGGSAAALRQEPRDGGASQRGSHSPRGARHAGPGLRRPLCEPPVTVQHRRGWSPAPRGRTTTLHAPSRTSVRLTLPSSTVRIGP